MMIMIMTATATPIVGRDREWERRNNVIVVPARGHDWDHDRGWHHD